jgi:hypothetical protein
MEARTPSSARRTKSGSCQVRGFDLQGDLQHSLCPLRARLSRHFDTLVTVLTESSEKMGGG